MGVLLIVNVVGTWHLFLGDQFVVNDLNPFSTHFLNACLLPYEFAGLGRDNPTPIPSLCDLGALSAVFGSALAQHLFLLLTMLLAAAGAFVLLKRIGHSWGFAVIGALMYEFAPALLNQFNQGGPGILFTAALIPLILAGYAPSPGSSPLVEGLRTGALIAVVSYVNPQAPVLLTFLLLPIALACFVFNSRSYAVLCTVVAAGTFLLAATPLVVNLPAHAAGIHASQQQLLSDFRYSLGLRGDWPAFLSAYLFVGTIPSLLGLLLITSRKSHPAEWAAAGTLILSVAFWEVLRRIGPSLAEVMPFVALFKDFIKLQILVSLPIVILSMMVVRRARVSWRRRPSPAPAVALFGLALLFFGPELGQILPAVVGGQLGLPENGRIPGTYVQVLSAINRVDPNVNSYRVLWIPMDGRVFHSFQALQPSALVFRGDSSADAQNVVLESFHAIVDGPTDAISPRLALEGVKYVIVDLVDGQSPGQPWQTGPPTIASVFNTQLLSGSVSDYVARLNSTPGLKLTSKSKGILVYRNLEWQPILSPYSSMLGVSAISGDGLVASAGVPARLNWVAPGGTNWHRTAGGTISIVGPAQHSWSPVSAVFPVVPGQDYLASGTMRFTDVAQAHAKVIWRGDIAPNQATSFLTSGHDGTGSVELHQVVVAPPGASSGELFLMGGWAAGPSPVTAYTNVAVTPVKMSPRLDGLVTNPEQRVSLWHEVPQVLLEPSLTPSSPADPALPAMFLTAGQLKSIPIDHQIRLLTHEELIFEGKWGIDSVPDSTGLEKYSELSSARILVPENVLNQVALGSDLAWLEYAHGATWPSEAVTHTEPIQPGHPNYVSCSVTPCRIANLLVVPPIKNATSLVRFAYARSDLLKTPDGHRAPKGVPGEWAAVYAPAPTGYPSSSDDPTAWPRWLSLLFGHVIIICALGFAWVRKFW